MAGFNTVRSALRLSAIIVAAGTILGLASSAAAQSRLERAERALQRAQQELESARRESGSSGQKVEVQCDAAGSASCHSCEGQPCEGPSCEGQEGDDDDNQANQGEQRTIELTVTTNDDGQITVEQPRGERRIERRMTVRGEGHTCPTCGRPMEDEGPRRIQLRGMTLPGGLGGLLEGPHSGHAKAQAFAIGGHEDGPFRVQTRGKVIVLDDNGQRREFNIGGGSEGGREGDENKHIEIRRFGGGEGAQGLPHNTLRLDGEGARAGHGEGHGVSGKIIIVGPDGQRQEFNLGGMGGGIGGGMGDGMGGDSAPARRRAPRIQIQEFRDGDAAPAHHDQGGERRVIEFRTVSRSQAL